MNNICSVMQPQGIIFGDTWSIMFPKTGAGCRGVLQGKTRDDMLIKVVGQTFIRHLEWLSGRPAPEAIQDHSYNILHARVLKVRCSSSL